MISCKNHWRSIDAASFLPIEQFLFIHKRQIIGICSKDFCSEIPYRFTGSAFIIGKIQEGSFAITAAHICEGKKMKTPKGTSLTVKVNFSAVTFQGKKYLAKALSLDSDIDICLMFIKELTTIDPVQLARKAPRVGDKVYNIGAPAGFFEPGMVSILEGRFAGNDPTEPIALYSLPAFGGSSGSMILNYKGRLLGVLHSVNWRFHHITLATTYEDTMSFIKKELKYFLIYRNDMEVLKLPNIFKVEEPKKLKKPKRSKVSPK